MKSRFIPKIINNNPEYFYSKHAMENYHLKKDIAINTKIACPFNQTYSFTELITNYLKERQIYVSDFFYTPAMIHKVHMYLSLVVGFF